MKLAYALLITVLAWTAPASADMLVIQIKDAGLPYDISPSNYDNSPSNYTNSPSNYDNSVSNYDNSPSNYDNSPSNYDNGIQGKRRLYLANKTMIGYYVFEKSGVVNFYNKKGRVAFMPAGGKTQSLIASEGKDWCGTLGTQNAQTVVGLTTACLVRFLADQ